MEFVIVSECECGFWSNQLGWVADKASASVFPSMRNYPVILRHHGDGHFIAAEFAPEFFLEEPLQTGDKVIWDEAISKVLHIESVKTSDGYARTSEDIVVLRDMSSFTSEVWEVCTRALTVFTLVRIHRSATLMTLPLPPPGVGRDEGVESWQKSRHPNHSPPESGILLATSSELLA